MPQTPWEELVEEFGNVSDAAMDGITAAGNQDGPGCDAKISEIEILIAKLKAIRARMQG